MTKQLDSSAKDPLEGKIIYVFIMTILVQFLYPISVNENPYIVMAFQLFYTSLFVAGVYMVSDNKFLRNLLIIATAAWLVDGSFFAFYPDSPHIEIVALIGYIIIGTFQISLAVAVFNYIFRTSAVSKDVLLAACTLYLLLGAVFVPVYGLIEHFTWYPDQITHAFTDGSIAYGDQVIPWQTFTYYSYATLSTLGYGDILPVTFWARSAATFEAVVGVLYTAVIVARLVGLYAAGEVEEEFEAQQRNVH